MKIKVCGITDLHNCEEIIKLPIHFLGFIFYKQSKRYISFEKFKTIANSVPKQISKVGVFVNYNLQELERELPNLPLDYIQLHGNESPEYCLSLKKFDIRIIKAFSVSNDFDFETLKAYKNLVDYYLFDTKGEQHGGNGYKFDWQILKNYPLETPYFLSGGISYEDANILKTVTPTPYSIDINSKFEISPGLKDENLLAKFINQLT